MKRYTLTLDSIVKDEPYYIFTFQKPDDLIYQNGQYGVFLHVDKEVDGRKMRAFTFASGIDSDVFQIATMAREELSDFKRLMLNLQPGDHMTVDGPMGHMMWDQEVEAVFIAGGIGITPVAGILDTEITNHATVLYQEPNKQYLFKDRFEEFNITPVYIESMPYLMAAIEDVSQEKPEAKYYVSGSMSFVGKVVEKLQTQGITKEQIKMERFTGY